MLLQRKQAFYLLFILKDNRFDHRVNWTSSHNEFISEVLFHLLFSFATTIGMEPDHWVTGTIWCLTKSFQTPAFYFLKLSVLGREFSHCSHWRECVLFLQLQKLLRYLLHFSPGLEEVRAIQWIATYDWRGLLWEWSQWAGRSCLLSVWCWDWPLPLPAEPSALSQSCSSHTTFEMKSRQAKVLSAKRRQRSRQPCLLGAVRVAGFPSASSKLFSSFHTMVTLSISLFVYAYIR